MSPIYHSALSSLRPYMAVIKDSFREAFASRVLWILLSISTLILLALAPLRIQEQRASQLHPRSIRDWPGLIERIYQQAQSDGGWKDYRDYQKDFATCRGEAFMIEQVINNPNS